MAASTLPQIIVRLLVYINFAFLDTIAIFMPDAVDGLSALGIWTVLYLCYFPEHQRKCQQEVRKIH